MQPGNNEYHPNTMTDKVPDFSKDELSLIKATLFERFSREIPLELADTELRLSPASTAMTLCPTVYWKVDDCHFLISKIDKAHYYNQFHYRSYQQYGTQKKRYDDLFDCIVSLLKVQAEYDKKEKGTTS